MNTRRFVLVSFVATAAVSFTGCGMMERSPLGTVLGMGSSMSVPLSGGTEVPPNASSGSGTAKFELNGSNLKWTVSYQGTTGLVTAGHIHGPAPAGANAGVVIPFSSTVSPIIGNATLTAAQLADLKAGLYYVNLHTAANPAGELRGQIK